MPYAVIPENAIAALPQLSGSAVKIMNAIASFMPGRGAGCYPSLAAIGERAGIKREKTISAAIKELTAAGVMVCERRRRQTNYLKWEFLEPAEIAPLGFALEPAVSVPVIPAVSAPRKETRKETNIIASSGSEETPPLDSTLIVTVNQSKAKKPSIQTLREQAAERIDALYRTHVPNEHNRKFGPAASQKRIVAILKTSKRTEEELARSVMNYAKEADSFPVGIRRFFSKQQGDMWEQYIEADSDVVKRGKSNDLSDLNYKLDGVLAQHGDNLARRYDAKARELGSTAAADAWLESHLQEALCQVN